MQGKKLEWICSDADFYLLSIRYLSILYSTQAQSVWEAPVHICQSSKPSSLECCQQRIWGFVLVL